jgi:hypothetical protein
MSCITWAFGDVNLLCCVLNMMDNASILPFVSSCRAAREAWQLLSRRNKNTPLSLQSKFRYHCNSVSMVEWAIDMGAVGLLRGFTLCALSASCGSIEVLQWARNQDPPCSWGATTCSKAAGNSVDVLQWLRAQDPPCPWNEGACLGAVMNGRLDALQWLRAQDPPCPWNEGACAAAAKNSQ